MQYLITDNEEIKIQVSAALSEVDGLGQLRTITTVDYIKDQIDVDTTSCFFVDEHLATRSALSVMQELSRSFPLIPVVLLTPARSSESVVAAMDAGARTVLSLPLSLEDINNRLLPVLSWSQAVRSEATSHEQHNIRKQGSVTAIVGAKGGVGTSTIALMTAAQLSQRGSTCLADFDLRNGQLASMVGVSVRRSIADLASIATEMSVRELADVTYPLPGGLDLLPAPEDAESSEKVSETATRQIISMLRYQFDHSILDCGDRLDDILATTLDSADRVLIVSTLDTPSLRGVRRLKKAFDRLDIAQRRPVELVINMSSKKREIQPTSVSRLVDLPLVVSVPDVSLQIETNVNTDSLLTSKLPALNKAINTIVDNVILETVPTTQNSPSVRPPTTRKRSMRHGRFERGQITVEFPVVFMLATVALILCVQALSIGVSYILAMHTANEAAHEYSIGKSPTQVQKEITDRLPSYYQKHAFVSDPKEGRVTVTLPVISIVDVHTSASAGIVWES